MKPEVGDRLIAHLRAIEYSGDQDHGVITDTQLREALRTGSPSFTLRDVADATAVYLCSHTPIYVDDAEARTLVAVTWIRDLAPRGFLARVRFVAWIARLVWRKR